MNGSKFRNCPEPPASLRNRLSVWAWVLVGVGCLLLLLLLLGGALALIRSLKNVSSQMGKSQLEPLRRNEQSNNMKRKDLMLNELLISYFSS